MNVTSGQQAVQIAQQWIGTPYQYGGGHGGRVRIGTPVDCSGLVDQVYGVTGNTLTQVLLGTSIPSINSALPGDLVFFGPLVPGEPHHVGIYIGSGQMIDAPYTGTTVRYDSVGGFGPIYGIRRLVPPTPGAGTSDGGNMAGVSPGNVNYSYAQLEGVWIQAGGNPQYAAMAAAIAMAESGGNASAYDPDPGGSVDRGLWQINSSNGSLSTFDVMGNARAAIQMSNNGTNWKPWCTAYSDGACGTKGGTYLGAGAPYQKFLNPNIPPDNSAPLNGTGAAAGPPQQANLVSCNFAEQFLFPGACAASGAASAAGGIVSGSSMDIAGSIINGLIGGFVNPLIQITAGVLGMAAGAGIFLGGMFLIVKDTQAYQQTSAAVDQGKGMLGFLAGPEAGMATEAAAGAKSQRQAPPPDTQQQLRTEAQRYGPPPRAGVQ